VSLLSYPHLFWGAGIFLHPLSFMDFEPASLNQGIDSVTFSAEWFDFKKLKKSINLTLFPGNSY
jgi:hypothetical protein